MIELIIIDSKKNLTKIQIDNNVIAPYIDYKTITKCTSQKELTKAISTLLKTMKK